MMFDSLEHQFDPIRSQSNGPSVFRFGIYYEEFHFFDWDDKWGGVQYPHELIRYCSPFMYEVFHHIFAHSQRQILSWKIGIKNWDWLSPPSPIWDKIQTFSKNPIRRLPYVQNIISYGRLSFQYYYLRKYLSS